MSQPLAPVPGPVGSPTGSGAPVLSVEHVDKSFGGTRALADASLHVRRGTVHALLGGNGSGKSTIIKILAAVHPADSGSMTVGETAYDLHSYTSQTAQDAGLRFVHQDLGLFEDLSIQENFALDAGFPRRSGGRIDWKGLRRHVADILAHYELDIDPRRPIRVLRPSDRTMVAIARALQDRESTGDEDLVLVLDEPTASLAAHESELLLNRVRGRAELGQTVVLVSHRLQEVLSVAHDFTIFRDGKVVGTLVDAEPSEDELIEIMAGGLVKQLRPTGSASHSTGRPVLEITDLHSGPLKGVDLTVHAGEIVGIAGLVGSGRSSLLQAIFGQVRHDSGSIFVDGKPHNPAHVDEAMDAGIALVPEDRGRDAGFADLTVRDNLAVAKLHDYWDRRWMPRGIETGAARDLIGRFGIKVSGPQALFSSMSGGNQQKTIIARWLQRAPKVLLLDEPSQGVDVMSRSDIYEVIREAAKDGCAVLVASSDLSEIHALADRIVVLSGGVITDELVGGSVGVEELTRLVLRDKGNAASSSTSRDRSSHLSVLPTEDSP